MGHAQAEHMVKAGRHMAFAAQGGAAQGERAVFAAQMERDAGGRIPGKILDVELVDHVLGLLLRRAVVFPAVGIGAGEVDDHGAAAVRAAGAGIGIGGAPGGALGGDQIIIIHAGQVPGGFIDPDTACAALHGNGFKRRAFCAVFIQAERDAGGGRRPEGKARAAGRKEAAQRLVGMKFLLEFEGIEILFEFSSSHKKAPYVFP